MKKILLLSFAFLIFTAVTKAQDATTTQTTQKEGMHKGHMRGMSPELMKQLNLTPDQKAQLKTLNESRKSKAEAIKNDATLSADQKKEAFHDLMKEDMKGREAIYTPDQKALIMKSRQDRKEGKWQPKKPTSNNQ